MRIADPAVAVIAGMLVVCNAGCTRTPGPGATASQTKPSAAAPTAGAPVVTTGLVHPIQTWTFDDATPGSHPRYVDTLSGTFAIAEDSTAVGSPTVLEGRPADAGPTALALLRDTAYADVELSIDLRAPDREGARSGGLVFRARDAAHHDAAIYDLTAGDLRIDRIHDGHAATLAHVAVRSDPAAWHVLRVNIEGNQIHAVLDGIHQLEARDETDPAGAAIGVLVGAQARLRFDNLRARALVRPLDAKALGAVLGVTPTAFPTGVVTASSSRTDVPITVDGRVLAADEIPAAWVAFTPTPTGAMVLGEIPLLAEHIGPAIDAALARGLSLTGLVGRLPGASPPLSFLQVRARGDATTLAPGIRALWEIARRAPIRHDNDRGDRPGVTPPPSNQLDPGPIGRILSVDVNGAEGRVSFNMSRHTRLGDLRVGATVGLRTSGQFTGRENDARFRGTFALLPPEIDPVARALRAAAFDIEALHGYSVGEQPPYYLMFYRGAGPARVLARGVRGALDAQAKATTNQADGSPP